MDYWFVKVCFLSLAGSGAMLAVWAACRLGSRQLSCRWRYYIWLLPLILLLLPVTPPQISAPSAPPVVEVPAATGNIEIVPAVSQPLPVQTGTAEAVQSELSAGETAVQTSLPAVPVQKTSIPSICIPELLGWIWLAGILLLLARHGVQAARLRRFLRRGAGAAEPWEQDLLEMRRLALGVRRPVALRRYAGAGSPFLSGLLRPAVYLPETPLTAAELNQVLTHELTHCRRRDLLVKRLAWLARTVHWFNPLAWLLEREVDYRCELACDEAVVRELDSNERRTYGLTLIKLMRGRNAPVPGSACLAERNIKTRLEVLMRPVKKQKYRRIWAVILALSLCLGATALAAEVNAQNPSGTYQTTQVLDLFYVDWLCSDQSGDRFLGENYGPGSGFNNYAAGDILLVDTPLQRSFSAQFTADFLYPYGRNATPADFLPASTFQVEMTSLERVIESRAEWVGRFTVWQDGVPIFTDEPGKLEHIPSMDSTQLTALTVGLDGTRYFYARFNFGLSGTEPMDGEAAAQAETRAMEEHPDTVRIQTRQSADAQIDGHTSIRFYANNFYVNDTLGKITCDLRLDSQEISYSSRFNPAENANIFIELRPQDVTAYDGDSAAGIFLLSLPNGQDREFAGTLSGLNGTVGESIFLRADDGFLAVEFTIEEDRWYEEPASDPRKWNLDRFSEEEAQYFIFNETAECSRGTGYISTEELPFAIATEENTLTVRYTGDTKYQAGAQLQTSHFGDWYGVRSGYESHLLEQNAADFQIPEDAAHMELTLYQVSTADGADFIRYNLTIYRGPDGALAADCYRYHLFNSAYTGAEAETMLNYGNHLVPEFMQP